MFIPTKRGETSVKEGSHTRTLPPQMDHVPQRQKFNTHSASTPHEQYDILPKSNDSATVTHLNTDDSLNPLIKYNVNNSLPKTELQIFDGDITLSCLMT